MKVKKSFEQAICIMLVLATCEGPVKSSELSQRLDVSDSYLKKITRQLVVAGLISSRSSKLGGFILNRNAKDITFLDIFDAIEGKDRFVETSRLVEKVFQVDLPIIDIEDYILGHLNKAEDKYRKTLGQINLADILNAAHGNVNGVKNSMLSIKDE